LLGRNKFADPAIVLCFGKRSWSNLVTGTKSYRTSRRLSFQAT
jgi:hypothetical protein